MVQDVIHLLCGPAIRSHKAVLVKISLYDNCLDGDESFGTNSTPEYNDAAGAKSARLSDGTDDYSSKTSESWDE